MGPRFNFFLGVCFLAAAPLVFGAEPARTDQSSDALEMISERMRSLTKSLEKMPAPPAFDQRIQLPDAFLQTPKPANSSDDDLFLEKESDV